MRLGGYPRPLPCLRRRWGATLRPMSDRGIPESRAAASVVICAYTVDRWLEIGEAVRSALGQATAPNREVILSVDHNPTLAQRALREWRTVRVKKDPACKVCGNYASK